MQQSLFEPPGGRRDRSGSRSIPQYLRKTLAPLEGCYEVVENRYVREPDGLTLEEKPSKKPGLPPTYLQFKGGQFASSIYTDNGHPEFEVNRIRYRMSTAGNRVEVKYLRVVKGRR